MRLLRIKDDVDVVRAANAYSEEVLRYGQQNQLQSLPTFERKTLGRMGLSHEAQRRVNKQARQPDQGTAARKGRGEDRRTARAENSTSSSGNKKDFRP